MKNARTFLSILSRHPICLDHNRHQKPLPQHTPQQPFHKRGFHIPDSSLAGANHFHKLVNSIVIHIITITIALAVGSVEVVCAAQNQAAEAPVLHRGAESVVEEKRKGEKEKRRW